MSSILTSPLYCRHVCPVVYFQHSFRCLIGTSNITFLALSFCPCFPRFQIISRTVFPASVTGNLVLGVVQDKHFGKRRFSFSHVSHPNHNSIGYTFKIYRESSHFLTPSLPGSWPKPPLSLLLVISIDNSLVFCLPLTFISSLPVVI